VAVEPFRDRDYVEGFVVVGQSLHGAVDRAVIAPIEVIRGDALCDMHERIVVEHQAAEHSLLGLDRMRRYLQRLGGRIEGRPGRAV